MKLTKRCIWFILICGIACTLSVNPVFADSDQTTDGEFGGISAANEVSYENDSTIEEEFISSENTEDDYTDNKDDIFSINRDFRFAAADQHIYPLVRAHGSIRPGHAYGPLVVICLA